MTELNTAAILALLDEAGFAGADIAESVRRGFGGIPEIAECAGRWSVLWHMQYTGFVPRGLLELFVADDIKEIRYTVNYASDTGDTRVL